MKKFNPTKLLVLALLALVAVLLALLPKDRRHAGTAFINMENIIHHTSADAGGSVGCVYACDMTEGSTGATDGSSDGTSK
ncbi:MAG: hypothetical protein HYT40_02880 [Candidatus Sungbacteria bacterium]|uniref:Uncharacterized protein n=1 Tax=Candidatus Sungiibacteriota bacterium TaxID=2750080 RepID=A0A931SCY0_9BACT|nr:hypothetical protein [Candidatus Sungbacteria bacterium]